jgi:glycine oxidase
MFKRKETADVAIIGGGVIGLTLARALRQRGVREVMLIERGRLGMEASWAAGGILAPQVEADHAGDFFRLVCASRDLYPAFAESLQEETGIEVEFDRSGTLCVGFTARDETELRRRYEWQVNEGLEVDWLTGDQARRLEPCLSPNIGAAMRLPNDWQVENRRLVAALISANQKLDVQLVTDCEVVALLIEGESVRGVETSQGSVATPIVVVAAGAWSSSIILPGAPMIDLEPVRGQMICFVMNPDTDSKMARHVIYGPRGYLVPRRDGRLLAGSTDERVGFDRRVSEEGINAIRAMALEIAPATAGLSFSSWAGFRPRAADGLPVLGPTEDIRGLFYATGHYRNGILLAPITGELIARAIVDGDVGAVATPFSPDRFSQRTAPAAIAV